MGTETILIVEDETALREVVVSLLQASGYRVLEAENAATALSVVQTMTEAIDLVITDVIMPAMRGVELGNRLRQLRPATKCKRRPLTKGTGTALSDTSDPLVGKRAFNRISGPDANSCYGCHNMPYGIPRGSGDFTTSVFVLGQRFDFLTFDAADSLPTKGAVDETNKRVTLQTAADLRVTTGMFGAGYLEMLARQMTAKFGNPGVGKTFLSKIIGWRACQSHQRVLFTTAMDMLNHLLFLVPIPQFILDDRLRPSDGLESGRLDVLSAGLTGDHSGPEVRLTRFDTPGRNPGAAVVCNHSECYDFLGSKLRNI